MAGREQSDWKLLGSRYNGSKSSKIVISLLNLPVLLPSPTNHFPLAAHIASFAALFSSNLARDERDVFTTKMNDKCCYEFNVCYFSFFIFICSALFCSALFCLLSSYSKSSSSSTFWVALFHLVGVICTGRWAGERKDRISLVTL